MKLLTLAAVILALSATTVMAATVYSYHDPKVFRISTAVIERMVDGENGVVCYTATKGGLGISISCLQTR